MAFQFTLSDAEQQYLKAIAREAIQAGVQRQPYAPPEPPTATLREHLGAFVTLTLHGELRGCIGHVLGDAPLYTTVAQMAQAAAFEDPRFPPLTAREFAEATLEISILSPVTPCPDPALVEVGRHGLIINRHGRSGLLLPQVAVDWGWSREEFLDHTCRKAGLPAECWRQTGTQLFWFEAVVF